MSVTVNIANHEATPWPQEKVTSPEALLAQSSPRHFRRYQRLVQTSFTPSSLENSHVSPSENAFVHAAWQAYSKHYHLTLRPEDVWFSILTQLSFYINAHAEELRSFFVEHEGQKELEAISDVADFGALAVYLTGLLAKNVKDPELREWVMPSFSTTTCHDEVVGAILFMGAMQKYFSYKMTICCGLPSVTLLGTVNDWKDILRRLDKIDLLGEEPRHFAKMLRPILTHMILTFEDPRNAKVTSFWNRIVHHNPMSSGTDFLTGWLPAFCYWNEKGEAKRVSRQRSGEKDVLFGDVEYPRVDIDDIPAGFASVPVKVDDNGHVFDSTMVAGSVGISANTTPGQQQSLVIEAGSGQTAGSVMRDSVQPVSGWWMYESEAPEAAEARATEMKQLEDRIAHGSAGLDKFEYGTEGWTEMWNRMTDLYSRLRELEAY